MMEEYEGIENSAPDACDAPSASNATATPGGQELELWSPAGEITHQIGVESEENQVDNAGVLRATSGNVTKRLKSRVLTRAEKSAEAAMRQFAAQERQAEKAKMKEWKDKVMQEMMRELHIIRQSHEEVVESQRQGFQIELERVGGKLEQLESRSKLLENEVKALKFPGQHTGRKIPPTKAVSPSSSGTQDEGEKRQTGEPESLEGSQTQQRIERPVTKASTPNQLKQTQSGVLQKSYA